MCEISISQNPQRETGLGIKTVKLSFGKSGFRCLLNTPVKIFKALLFNRNIMQTINASQRHNLKFYSSYIKKKKGEIIIIIYLAQCIQNIIISTYSI